MAHRTAPTPLDPWIHAARLPITWAATAVLTAPPLGWAVTGNPDTMRNLGFVLGLACIAGMVARPRQCAEQAWRWRWTWRHWPIVAAECRLLDDAGRPPYLVGIEHGPRRGLTDWESLTLTLRPHPHHRTEQHHQDIADALRMDLAYPGATVHYDDVHLTVTLGKATPPPAGPSMADLIAAD